MVLVWLLGGFKMHSSLDGQLVSQRSLNPVGNGMSLDERHAGRQIQMQRQFNMVAIAVEMQMMHLLSRRGDLGNGGDNASAQVL